MTKRIAPTNTKGASTAPTAANDTTCGATIDVISTHPAHVLTMLTPDTRVAPPGR
ncbi:hypothetical protein AB0C12_21815 [Actinoplanes sp. NPDC048967]|uniref:hypothetical protein n=1 Tax=Actinoplanes sp. NPDC048967 TaxID=3155269 RepID=UPI0033FD12CA